jgi:PTH1 family peptidyl-tRNA hydrolase
VKLFVGLGNPGAGYARNRHNVGFMAVEAIAEAHGFTPWRSKFHGELAEGRLGLEKVLLLKPQTYMNLSGDAVQAAMAFYKLEPKDVVVFHDELDLAPERVRVKRGGGHAGHNGLRSIAGHIGPDFLRVRLGIGHPGDKRLVTNYVLGDFAKQEAGWVENLLKGVAAGAPKLADGDSAGFLAELARHLPQPKEKPVKPAQASKPAAMPAAGAPPAATEDTRTPLQRLADRFR